jgi:hypothetical protein
MEWSFKMSDFVINVKAQKGPQEMYEIHNFSAGCESLPEASNSINLGEFGSAAQAQEKARLMFIYPQICRLCCGKPIVIPKAQPRTALTKRVARPV